MLLGSSRKINASNARHLPFWLPLSRPSSQPRSPLPSLLPPLAPDSQRNRAHTHPLRRPSARGPSAADASLPPRVPPDRDTGPRQRVYLPSLLTIRNRRRIAGAGTRQRDPAPSSRRSPRCRPSPTAPPPPSLPTPPSLLAHHRIAAAGPRRRDPTLPLLPPRPLQLPLDHGSWPPTTTGPCAEQQPITPPWQKVASKL